MCKSWGETSTPQITLEAYPIKPSQNPGRRYSSGNFDNYQESANSGSQCCKSASLAKKRPSLIVVNSIASLPVLTNHQESLEGAGRPRE
jgi:hypothetical protein